MTRRTWRGWLSAGCLAALLVGCTQPEVKVLERGEPKAKHRVLIATQSSEFKAQVVSTMLGQLAVPDTYVKVVDLRKVADEPAAGYDIIVLLAAAEWWTISSDAKAFIERTEEKGKLVLLSTHRMGKYTRSDVDTVTSASKVEDAAAVAGELGKRIQAILGK